MLYIHILSLVLDFDKMFPDDWIFLHPGTILAKIKIKTKHIWVFPADTHLLSLWSLLASLKPGPDTELN